MPAAKVDCARLIEYELLPTVAPKSATLALFHTLSGSAPVHQLLPVKVQLPLPSNAVPLPLASHETIAARAACGQEANQSQGDESAQYTLLFSRKHGSPPVS